MRAKYTLSRYCITQLDYGVTWQKLKDIFKVAGRIVNADILTDREGHSKGLGEVQFEDSSEAIGAIGRWEGIRMNEKHWNVSMWQRNVVLLVALFHGQMLSDRPMTVRMVSLFVYACAVRNM